jgi:hypothetical protein
VLKLFDRRFGTDLRFVYGARFTPHTQAHEAAFQTLVRQGMMVQFLDELKEANEARSSPPEPMTSLRTASMSPRAVPSLRRPYGKIATSTFSARPRRICGSAISRAGPFHA